MMKSFAAVTCVLVTAVTTLQAQGTRPFRDSWFWGVQTGVMTYASGDPANPGVAGGTSVAPQFGADWLITRTTGGLYVSFAQAFLTTTGLVVNGPTSADTGFRAVDVKNLRRFNLAAMAFPGNYRRWHPYVGAGMAFGYLGAAAPQISTTDQQKQIDFAASAVSEAKAALGPLFIAGGQYRLRGVSLFGQVSASAMSRDFLLANGHSLSVTTEFGLRYNIGSSIER